MPDRTLTATGVVARLAFTTPLPDDLGYIPVAPELDFAALARAAGAPGVFDPNSVEVIDLADGQPVSCRRGDAFAHGDVGTIAWRITDPTHTDYAICFRTVPVRPPLRPQVTAPLIGLGDLLRYNAGVPRPVTLHYSMRLADLTGDGRADLLGCWNYFYGPHAPVSGVVAYPRTADGPFTVGDMVHLRYRDPDTGALCPFPGIYQEVDVADLDGDGQLDLAAACWDEGAVRCYRHTGERDAGGWPIFTPAGAIPVPLEHLRGLQLVDLDGDGAVGLVACGQYIRNANPAGWPFQPKPPVDLGTGPNVAFLDLTGDGRLDALCLVETPEDPAAFPTWAWRPRVAENPPAFGPPRPVPALDALRHPTLVRAARDGAVTGVLVQHDVYQRIAFVEVTPGDPPRFTIRGEAGALAAVLSLSDQAWPCVCDWDGDGAWDLLVGGGYGWPRVVRNQGTAEYPAFADAEVIEAGGTPLRLLRDDLLGGRHWHNMGYPYPVFADWDGDGLPDLLLPHETNRLLWCRNIGAPGVPRFAAPAYLEVDGCPDSAEQRAASGHDAADPDRARHPYPRDVRSPFDWRCGAAVADWNGDGLPDLITYDHDRVATLFVQYRDGDTRRLRREGPLRLDDGRIFDDEVIPRATHWTASFRAVDWNGDGRLDLLYCLAGSGAIYLLRNVGTRQAPRFTPPRRLACYGTPLAFTHHGPHAWPADLNADGRPDLIACVEWSVYPCFAHAALEMPSHPAWELVDVTLAT